MDHLDYTKYFNLKDNPFRLLPDPSFFFPSEPHIKAKEVLLYGINRGEGFMILVGEAGTGKSLLLRMLLLDLPPEKETAIVVAPKVSPSGLMRLILEDMGIQCDDIRETALLQKIIEEAIIKLGEAGKELLIIIDEAQNLPLDTLEQLRLLSNIETSRKKLLQILLVGQPELISLINSPGLGQLAQRICIMESLRPLNMKEMEEYVSFRLNKAGGILHIKKSALKTLYRASSGIPRIINKIMDRTLLVAASRGTKEICSKNVKHALETLPDSSLTLKQPVSRKGNLTAEKTKKAVFAGFIVASIVAAVALFTYKLHVSGHIFPKILGVNGTMSSKNGNTQSQMTMKAHSSLQFGVVRIKRAFIREGPGTEYPRFTTASLGDRLKIEGKKGEWLKVRVYDSRGNKKTGWIRQDLVIIEK